MRFKNRSTTNEGGWADVRLLVLHHRGRLLILALLAFLGAVTEAVFLVLLTSVAVALVNESESVDLLARSVGFRSTLTVAAILLLVRLVVNGGEMRQSALVTAEIVNSSRRMLSDSYLGTTWEVQHAEPAGRLQELLTSFVDRVSTGASSLALALSAILSLGAFLGSSVVISPAYTVAVLIAVIGFGLILGPLRTRVRRLSALQADSNVAYASMVAELGSLGMEMQTFGVRDKFVEQIREATAANTRARFRAIFAMLITPPIYLFLAYGAILLGVGLLTRSETTDLTIFGAVLLLMMRSLAYGQNLQAALGNLAAQMPFIHEINHLTGQYQQARASGGSVVPAEVLPLEFRQVHFSYERDREALTSINLRIDAGELFGIAGPSGAGKSTLAQLILGLRDPDGGSITVHGVDLRDVDRAWWTTRVAHVSQDAQLITGTVSENIRFFREGLDEDAVVRAAQRANLLEDVSALPEGFATRLGERGNRLSGGQRQRLAIARALVGEPELMMLDEPTSALDGRSESLIRETLGSLKDRVTVILIAHRMSLLETCDRVAVIEAGRISGLASPDELRRTNAFYRRALDLAKS